jgi:hypothetical protein
VRRFLIVLVAVILALVAGRVALDPLATWQTRRRLAGLAGMRGRVSAVEVKLLDLSCVVHDLRIEKRRAGGAALPFVEVKEARFGLLGKELLHGHVVARIDLERPKLNIVQADETKGTGPGQGVHEVPSLGKQLEERAPLRVDRVQVRNGEVLWVDAREPTRPRLWLHSIEATLENLATRPALSRGEPTVLAGRGIVQKTGRASFFATADPLAKKLTFAGQGRLEGLALADLGELLAAKEDVVPDKGPIDLSLRFRAVDGNLTGGIRPILKDAGTRPAKPDLGAKLKSALADASFKIFKDDVPGRNAVATTIPIEGRVDDPKMQLVPTMLGVVRNAFVRGLTDSLEGLPPPKAKEKEGVVQQARRALSPNPRAQPRAQPQK